MLGRVRLALALLLALCHHPIAGSKPAGAVLHRRCDRGKYRNGSWVMLDNATFRAPYRLERDPRRNPFVKGWAYAGRRFWGSCDEGMQRPRRAMMQRWQPDACDLKPFVAEAFCKRWRRQPLDILFVGDSYTGQLFISLIAMLGGSIVKNEGSPRTAPTGAIVFGDVAIAELRADAIACIDTPPDAFEYVSDSPGKGQRAPLRISFVRNELLQPNEKEPKSSWRHEYPWTHLLKPKTLFVTQALAWFGQDGPFPVPSLYLPCTFPVPSLYLRHAGACVVWAGRALPCTFPVPSLYLPCTFVTQALAWFGQDGPNFNRSLHRLSEVAEERMSKGNPKWRQQILLFSASHGHHECRVETKKGWVVPGRGPKGFKHDYDLLNRVSTDGGSEFPRTRGRDRRS
jgi:hypothetical protein